MTNCCNDYGVCTQSKDCPARKPSDLPRVAFDEAADTNQGMSVFLVASAAALLCSAAFGFMAGVIAVKAGGCL